MDYLRIPGVASPKSTVRRLLKRNGWGKIKKANKKILPSARKAPANLKALCKKIIDKSP